MKGSGGGSWYSWAKATPGTEIVFRLKGRGTGIYEGKETFHAKGVFADGTEKNINAPAILADKLNDAKVEDILLVRFVGQKAGKPGRNGAKDFYVEVLDSFPTSAATPTPAVVIAPPGTVPNLAAIAAAAAGGASELDGLVAILREKNPKAEVPLMQALQNMSPADAAAALRGYLKQSGFIQ